MITIDLKADDLEAALTRLAVAMADMTPVMETIGEKLRRGTTDRFPRGEAPDGSAWAPKSQTTLDAYRAREDRADPRPLYGPTGRLSSEIAWQAGPSSVEVGSSLIYAAVMQFGAAQGAFGRTDRKGPIPWGTIPARPFLGLSDQDELDVVAIVENWLSDLASGED